MLCDVYFILVITFMLMEMWTCDVKLIFILVSFG